MLDRFLAEWHEPIQRLHASPSRLGIVATGGGLFWSSVLQMVPGASATIELVECPYAARQFDRWLGRAPDGYCTESTALAMAARCWGDLTSELPLSSADTVMFGEIDHLVAVAVTAALATSRPKSGPHRAHVAIQSRRSVQSLRIEFEKGKRSRVEEELLLSSCVLAAVSDACGVKEHPEPELTTGDYREQRQTAVTDELLDLLESRCDVLWLKATSSGSTAAPEWPEPVLDKEPIEVRGVLSGAFNPLHEGHLGLRDAARRRLGGEVAFELTIKNADKPPLDALSLRDRCRQSFAGPVCLTRAATFVEKSRLFPGCAFVVGFDTAVRILEPRFYGDSSSGLVGALREFAESGCRFLVAGRVVDGVFQGIEQLRVPHEFAGLFAGLSESEFRVDQSSTHLRQTRSADGDC